MHANNRFLKIISYALSFVLLGSCAPASEESTEAIHTKESVFESLPETEETTIPLSDTETTTAPTAEEIPEYLIGADGNPVPTAKGRKDENDDQWYFDDFTFYREATGLTFYDDSYMEMEDSWKVLRVGDVFGSLTVTEAHCEYYELALQYENATKNRLPDHDAIWYSRSVTFDGTVTLYGKIFADMREGAFGGGVLLFQPNPISLKEAGFPMLKSVHFSWATDSVYTQDNHSVEDSDVFILGDADEYGDIFDYASFVDEEEHISVYAEVQLTDIKVNYGTPTGSYPCGDRRARMLSVKMIDPPNSEISPISSDTEEAETTEPQDDFSDIVELTDEQTMERFDQIAERAFHTEIKNDMGMEEIISLLMDRYIICTNTYDVRTLFDWDFDEQFEYLDHTYYKMQHRYFNALSEMEDFVRGTFTHEEAEIWISTSSSEPSSNTYVPRFIQKEDGIYFCIPDYVFIPPPSFLDNHIIEIKECSETECVFSYNANIDLKRHKQMCEATGEISWPESAFLHEGKIVLEDGEWKIDSIFPAAF